MMNVLMKFVSFLFMFPGSVNPVVHDFHVSKLDVRYNPATQSFELTLHLFLDDLEKAMNVSGFSVKSLQTNDENAKSSKKINDYLTTKIRVKADNTLLSLHYIGREEAERFDAVFIYLEAAHAGIPAQLNIENLLFNEVFDDQKNIVSVTFDKKLKAFEVLDKKNPSLDVTF